LEERGVEVYLVKAWHAKNLPGRKSDPAAAADPATNNRVSLPAADLLPASLPSKSVGQLDSLSSISTNSFSAAR
jgi:hypothetical protein